MELKNDELIKEFYEQQKELHPDLTIEQIKDICFGPWRFLKSEMESGDLPTVRFKYFGTFQVYEGRARNMLYNNEKKFKFHKISPKQYYKLQEMLKRFLERCENNKQNNDSNRDKS